MAELVTIVLALLFVLTLLVYKYLTWHFNDWKRLGVDGPKPTVLVGNFPSVFNGKQHIVYDIDAIYRKYKKSKRAIGVFMNRNPEVLIVDPQLAHDVMVTHFRNFADNLSTQWVGHPNKDKYAARNPFLMPNASWKSKRGETIGGLTANKLALAYPIWLGAAKKLTQFLEVQTRQGAVELESKDLVYRFTLAIMCDFLWGIDAATFADPGNTSNAIMSHARQMLAHSFVTVGMHFQLSVVPFLKRFFDLRFFPASTDAFFAQITKEAIAMRLQNSDNDQRADFLNYLIQLQEKKAISNDDIVGHILTALLDGYETASIVIYHTLFYLAKHPEQQQRLRVELLQLLGEREALTFDELNSCVFLDNCVHETIRLITPIPVYSRFCTQATKLQVDGERCIDVQQGTLVNIPIFSFHHDEEYFPQPYAYRPERFDATPHGDLTKQGIFMPFGDGPRICLGLRTGLLEVKTCIATVLRNYRVECCARTMAEKRPDSNAFVLGLEGDFWLRYVRL